jgi:translation initiation factor 3 subunit C
MSNFWEDDEPEVPKPEQQNKANPFAVKGTTKNYTYDDSESSEEEKRVVKTPKEKIQDMLKDNYSKIKDVVEEHDYQNILKIFDDTIKQSEKMKTYFPDKLPDKFLRILILVEDSLNISKEEKAKLSPKNNTAYNSLKKNFTKLKGYEAAIKQFRENPPEEEEEKEDEISEDKNLSDVSSVEDIKNDQNDDPAIRRLKWVKKKDVKKEVIKKRKDRPTTTTEVTGPVIDTKSGETSEEEIETSKKEIKITEGEIEKECNEISNQRGHLQKKPMEIVSRIDYLLSNTENIFLKIKLLNLYIHICFDTSAGQFSALSLEMWNKIHASIITMIEYFQIVTTMNKDSEQVREQSINITFLLQASLVTILEKLELELYKALQFTDWNSSEYMNRVRDELKFLLLCSRIENFYKDVNDQVSISRIYLLIILHIYYKNEDSIKKMIERFNLQVTRNEYLIKSCENPEQFISQLCDTIYAFCDEKSKVKAMLANVYFLCIHNRYQSARNLFQRSYIFEIIQILKDDQLKILYNRTLAQLGLCAFRHGSYKDSLGYLNPLCSTGTSKLKEYLSQSYNKENEKSLFFDKDDKKRVIPYIMTINLDEIESTYYLVSMILDLPNIILFKLGRNYKTFNPMFKKLLDNYEKQVILY